LPKNAIIVDKTAFTQDMTRYAKGYDDKGQLMPPMPEFTPSLYTVKSTTKDMLEYLESRTH